MQKVAVASSDGITINEHFGQARHFLLYQVEDDGTFTPAGDRVVNHLAPESSGHHATELTAQALSDVDAVLVARIGPGGADTLKAIGVKAFAVVGTIERALSAYGKRHKFLDQKIPGVSGCAPAGGGNACGCPKGCK